MENIIINGNNLTLEEVIKVSRKNYKIQLEEEAKGKILDSRKIIDDIVEKEKVVYGVTTGFGKFSEVSITQDDCKTLQRNLIISHACGFGPNFSKEVVRAIMLLRINALAKGYSGIRLETLNTLGGYA